MREMTGSGSNSDTGIPLTILPPHLRPDITGSTLKLSEVLPQPIYRWPQIFAVETGGLGISCADFESIQRSFK